MTDFDHFSTNSTVFRKIDISLRPKVNALTIWRFTKRDEY